MYGRGLRVSPTTVNVTITILATLIVFNKVGSVTGMYRHLIPFVTFFCIVKYVVVLKVGFSFVVPTMGAVYGFTFAPNTTTKNLMKHNVVVTVRCKVTEKLFSGRSNVNSTPVTTTTTRAEGPIHRTLISDANAF